MERKVLYNLLRMNWVYDQKMEVEPWQVDNYRVIEEKELFSRLAALDIRLDKEKFIAFAQDFEEPYDLTDALAGDREETLERDQILLIVFELWRRFLYDKPCLPVFCDELDWQIYLYDSRESKNTELLEDALAELEVILDESTDEGGDPKEVFETISELCANDLENFLYDYIDKRVENSNLSYASELVDAFADYVSDERWFTLLRVRIEEGEDRGAEAKELLESLIAEHEEEPDLALGMEILRHLKISGNSDQLCRVVDDTLLFAEEEEDFQEILERSSDFYGSLDAEKQKKAVDAILEKRKDLAQDAPFDDDHPEVEELLKILRENRRLNT